MFIDQPVMVLADEQGALAKLDIGVCQCRRVYGLVEDNLLREMALEQFGERHAVFVWGPNWVRCPHCKARIQLPTEEERSRKDRPRARMETIAETAVIAMGLSSVTVIPMQEVMTLTLRDRSGQDLKVSIPHGRLAGTTDDEILAALIEAWQADEGEVNDG